MAELTLQVIDGPDRGRVFQARKTPVTIGREEGNGVQLNDERVSRYHLKIHEDGGKLVLTDLDSTNGTKVNGETTQIKILRPGDVVAVGKTMLVIGSREQIAGRLRELRKKDENLTSTLGPEQLEALANLDFELSWSPLTESWFPPRLLKPPDLPEHLKPSQAAELSELLEYFHVRMREVLESTEVNEKSDSATIDQRHWQILIDLQGRLAEYMRKVADPEDK